MVNYCGGEVWIGVRRKVAAVGLGGGVYAEEEEEDMVQRMMSHG